MGMESPPGKVRSITYLGMVSTPLPETTVRGAGIGIMGPGTNQNIRGNPRYCERHLPRLEMTQYGGLASEQRNRLGRRSGIAHESRRLVASSHPQLGQHRGHVVLDCA